MKLIHYTIRKLSVVMIIILTAWAALFSFNIFEEVWDETDDSLENFKILIIRQFMQDTTSLNLGDKDLMSQYHIREITEKEAIHYKERYFDSTRFYETELEFDPIRVLKTAFRGPNSKFYELTIQMSTLEKDDMIRAMLTWVIILYFVLFICLITISNIVFRKSWKPFYKLMNWLNQFTPGSQIAPLDNPTRVNEFKQLNTAIQQMAQRSEDMYAQQKQFIENASHELQTPLAICQNKLELLAENTPCTEEQLQEIGQIQDTIRRAVLLNKSLLLLSRIENGQFHDRQNINMNSLIQEITEDFSEIYEYKNIQINIEEHDTCDVQMNDILANVLISNLIKNAMIHSPNNGEINISIQKHDLVFSNTSNEPPLDPQRIFRRFYQSDYKKSESTGLGLAIVNSIIHFYHFQIKYYHNGKHNFQIFLQ